MKKAALFFGLALLCTTAYAQSANEPATAADPALNALNQVDDAGPSELDQLSRGSSQDFPDIEKKQQRKPVSVTLRALNKITAKYTDITIKMNETARFGSLEITPRYCDKRPPEEFPETTAFVEIADTAPKPKPDEKIAVKVNDAAPASEMQTAPGDPADKTAADEGAAPAPASRAIMTEADAARAKALDEILSPDQHKAELPPGVIFSGWMFASSPALNALQHPVYDVWVIDCKTVSVDN